MKKVLILAALLAMVALGAVVANATPTFTGPTGGVSLPDVNVTPTGTLDVALDYHRQDLDNADEATNLRFTYGLSDKSEVGIKYSWQAGKSLGEGFTSSGLNNWGVSAKYKLPVTYIDLDFAAGVQYAKYKDLSTEQTQLYVVGGTRVWESYDAVQTLDFNVGINWIKFDVSGSDTDKFHAFTVLKYGFNPSLHLVGEYQTEADPDTDALSSLALRYQMDENLSWQFGVTNSFRGVTGAGQHNWFIGANYNFTSFAE